jgi:hypothetical protein
MYRRLTEKTLAAAAQAGRIATDQVAAVETPMRTNGVVRVGCPHRACRVGGGRWTLHV